MKAAIIYSSKHGATQKVAWLTGDKLTDYSVVYLNLRNNAGIDLSESGTVIIGCSVYSGKNQTEVRKFIKNNILRLLQVKIGLFLCCLNQIMEKSEFEAAYPELLHNHSAYNAIVGGELLAGRLNFLNVTRFVRYQGSLLRYNCQGIQRLKTKQILSNRIKHSI